MRSNNKRETERAVALFLWRLEGNVHTELYQGKHFSDLFSCLLLTAEKIFSIYLELAI